VEFQSSNCNKTFNIQRRIVNTKKIAQRSKWRMKSIPLLAVTLAIPLVMGACAGPTSSGGSGAATDTLAKIQEANYATLGSYNQLAHGWFDGGKWHGMDVDIVESILPKLGVKKWDYTVADWSALIPGLVAKRWDLMSIGMNIRPDRAKVVLFSAPVYRAGSVLIVKDGSDIKGHAQFPGKKIGAVLGGSEVDDIKSVAGAEAVVYKTAGDMYADLVAGRIDAIEMDEGEAAYSFKQNPIAGFTVLHEWEGKIWFNNGIVMRLGDTQLKAELDKQIADLKSSGKMLQILETYGFGASNMVDAQGEAATP
jgi:polar amino acid transport system substrate-binding protein